MAFCGMPEPSVEICIGAFPAATLRTEKKKIFSLKSRNFSFKYTVQVHDQRFLFRDGVRWVTDATQSVPRGFSMKSKSKKGINHFNLREGSKSDSRSFEKLSLELN